MGPQSATIESGPRADARPLPGRDGVRERDGVRLFWERYGDGEPHGAAAADLVDRPFALLEAADPVPRAPLPRAHVRRPRQRPVGPAGGRRGTTSTDQFAADAIAVMDATGVERATLVAHVLRGAVGDGRGRRASRAGRAGSCTSRRRWRSRPHIPSVRCIAFDEPLDTDEGWAKYNSHYWLRGLPRVPRVLLRRSASTSRTRASRSRTASTGRSRPARRRSPTRPAGSARRRRAFARALLRACAARRW